MPDISSLESAARSAESAATRVKTAQWNVASAPRRPAGAALVRPVPHRHRAKGDSQGREVIIAADPVAWLGLVEGRANLVTELRASRPRYYDPNRRASFASMPSTPPPPCSG